MCSHVLPETMNVRGFSRLCCFLLAQLACLSDCSAGVQEPGIHIFVDPRLSVLMEQEQQQQLLIVDPRTLGSKYIINVI